MAVSNLYQSVIFELTLAKWYSDTQIVICQWKLHNYKTYLNYFCLSSKLIYPGSFEKLHMNCVKELVLNQKVKQLVLNQKVKQINFYQLICTFST